MIPGGSPDRRTRAELGNDLRDPRAAMQEQWMKTYLSVVCTSIAVIVLAASNGHEYRWLFFFPAFFLALAAYEHRRARQLAIDSASPSRRPVMTRSSIAVAPTAVATFLVARAFGAGWLTRSALVGLVILGASFLVAFRSRLGKTVGPEEERRPVRVRACPAAPVSTVHHQTAARSDRFDSTP